MTRVLHVFGRLNRGGAELRTIDILRRMNADDPCMEFVSLSGLPGELDEEIRARGGQVHYCRLDVRFPWRFAQLLRERQIDVVHSHVYHSSGFILRCAAMAGIPIRIAHFRSCSSGKPANIRRWVQERVLRHWLNKWATLIIGNSEASLDHGWRSDWALDPRCAVIHNGLDVSTLDFHEKRADVRAEFGWPESCPVAIHIGRMDPAKNHERLLEIWAEMAAANDEWRFLAAGRLDQELFAALQAKAARHSLASKIVWAGPRTDIGRLLSAADTMIFPSRWEGLPGAVLEANAAGVGVVGSDIPPIREIASHLDNVACVPLSAPNSYWQQTVNKLCSSASSRHEARVAFERSVYGIERCVQAHRAIWQGANAQCVADIYRDISAVATLEAA